MVHVGHHIHVLFLSISYTVHPLLVWHSRMRFSPFTDSAYIRIMSFPPGVPRLGFFQWRGKTQNEGKAPPFVFYNSALGASVAAVVRD